MTTGCRMTRAGPRIWARTCSRPRSAASSTTRWTTCSAAARWPSRSRLLAGCSLSVTRCCIVSCLLVACVAVDELPSLVSNSHRTHIHTNSCCTRSRWAWGCSGTRSTTTSSARWPFSASSSTRRRASARVRGCAMLNVLVLGFAICCCARVFSLLFQRQPLRVLQRAWALDRTWTLAPSRCW